MYELEVEREHMVSDWGHRCEESGRRMNWRWRGSAMVSEWGRRCEESGHVQNGGGEGAHCYDFSSLPHITISRASSFIFWTILNDFPIDSSFVHHVTFHPTSLPLLADMTFLKSRALDSFMLTSLISVILYYT